MKKKPSLKILNIGISLLTLTVVLAVFVLFHSYRTSEEKAIESGENQLTQTNEYVVRLLKSAIKSNTQSISKLIESNKSQVESDTFYQLSAKKTIEASDGELLGIFYVDHSGKTRHSYLYKNSQLIPASEKTDYLTTDPTLKEALLNRNLRLGKDYFIKKQAYVNFYHPVYDKNNKMAGQIVVPMSLSRFFQNELRTSNNKYNGYSMVKDTDMRIIMHPSKEQIGLSIVSDRKNVYPGRDFDDLAQLEKYQLGHSKGVSFYDSYWWTQKNSPKVRKLNAFQWVTIGGSHWIIATITDFYERNDFLTRNIPIMIALLMIIISTLLLVVLAGVIYKKQEKTYFDYLQLQQKQEYETQRHKVEKEFLHDSKLSTIGLLTTSIVHDMNNFLTPLKGQTELLMESHQDDPELEADLNEIFKAAEKGQQLSTHVLRFSKIEEDEDLDNFEITDVVKEAIETIHMLIPKKIELKLVGGDIPGAAYFVKEDLQILLYNLITNAFQAIGKNKGTITITLTRTSTDQVISLKENNNMSLNKFQKTDAIMITVADTGSGIPSEIREQIFKPFFTTKNEKGTGLGLFIVSSVANKYDWTLSLEEAEVGTHISLMIPLLEGKKLE